MANESFGGIASSKLPQAKRLVPGGGKSISAIRRNHLDQIRICLVLWVTIKSYAVGNDVGMAVQTSFGIAICSLIASKVPDYQCLVSAPREEHVRATKMFSTLSIGDLLGTALFERCSQAGDPAAVAFKRTTVYELFSHGAKYVSDRVGSGLERLCRRGRISIY